jgi:DNA invertase Pin-like site-specific DNA recombinase
VTTYLYGDRGSTQAVAAWKDAEAAGVAIDQAILRRPIQGRARLLRLHDNLAPGDTLVIDELGALGETYQEIVDAVRELMRRKVLLRSMEDNLIFDGLAVRPGEQASRDALIAYVAATAMDKKAARRAAQTRQAMLAEKPPEQWEEQAGRLQFRVIAGQLAAFAVAIYLLGGLLPASHRREAPRLGSETLQARQSRAASPLTPPRSMQGQSVTIARPAPALGRDQASAAASDRNRSGPAPLGLSQAQARQAYATVANWRSARLDSPGFNAEIGAQAPPQAHLAIFPRRLVARLPALRGYKFVVAGQRVAVVDPATRKVVAVVNQ